MSKKTNPVSEVSVTCGFYNSLDGDRTYDATQMSKIFDGIIGDGIFATIGDHLIVKAGSGTTVNVGTGKAWFNHTWTLNDAVLPIDCGEAEIVVGMDRIDAIVVEVDTTLAVRDNFIKVIHGTSGANPAKPALNTQTGVYQYALCYIYRTAGNNEITQDNITNAVGTEETPFVTGVLEVISVDELCLQWRANLDTFMANEKSDLEAFMSDQENGFNEWFNQMKTLMSDAMSELNIWTENQKNIFLTWFQEMRDQLSEDAAGNLQLQIDKEEIRRTLLVGFIDGTKTFSEDGSVSTATDSSGRTLVKTFTDNFMTSTTVLSDAYGNELGRLVKTFSEDGLMTSSEVTIV